MTIRLQRRTRSWALFGRDYEWDSVGAEAALRRALELNPNYAWGHAHLSDWLLIMGRYEEGIAEQNLAVGVSIPSRQVSSLSWGRSSLMDVNTTAPSNRYTKLWNWTPPLNGRIYSSRKFWLGRQRDEESLSVCEKVAALSGATPYTRGLRSLILGITGKIREAKRVLNDLKKGPKPQLIGTISLAEAYSVLDEKDEAFELLEEAYQQRVSMLVFLAVMPTFGNIRTDPRYVDLLRRMGLPA